MVTDEEFYEGEVWDVGYWDSIDYERALVVTEPDPEVRATLAKIYGIDPESLDNPAGFR